MPSSEFDALALLIVLVLAVVLVNTWLLTTRPPRQSKTQPSAPLHGIPLPAEPFEPVPPPSEPQAVLDARYVQARRREQRETRPLAESEWYGGGGDGYWPQAR